MEYAKRRMHNSDSITITFRFQVDLITKLMNSSPSADVLQRQLISCRGRWAMSRWRQTAPYYRAFSNDNLLLFKNQHKRMLTTFTMSHTIISSMLVRPEDILSQASATLHKGYPLYLLKHTNNYMFTCKLVKIK